MACSTKPHDNFLRCHEGLQLVCSSSLPSVQSAIESWHKIQLQKLQPCKSPATCPSFKKPTSKHSACQSCIDWGMAIENVFYEPVKGASIYWRNVNVPLVHKDPVEIAKAFIFLIPAGEKHSRFADFDTGSILKLMVTFEQFHHGDVRIIEAADKVANVRNTLSHMKIRDNLTVDDKHFEQYFAHFLNLVDCLEKASYFKTNQAQDLRQQLNTIRISAMSTDVENRVIQSHFRALADKLELEMQHKFDKQTEHLQKMLSKKSTASEPKGTSTSLLGKWKDKLWRSIKPRVDNLNLEECQRELRWHYKNRLCKIPLYPGDVENCVNLNDIYTKLSLVLDIPKPCTRVLIPLESYKEMFTRKNDVGELYTKFIITAGAGLGKTTITAKMAHDWAIGDKGSPLYNVPLLFVLNMRWVDHSSNIEDVVLSQLLPTGTKITQQQLRNSMEQFEGDLVIILDALDEADRDIFNHPEECGTIVKLLTGNILLPCRVVVTSRPWRASEITGVYKEYTKLELRGFAPNDVKAYITKFFTEDLQLGKRLLNYIKHNDVVVSVASVPLMALLICLFWKETNGEEIPNRISSLYDYILYSMNCHLKAKESKSGVQDQMVMKIEDIVKQLGNVALCGLWPPENRLFFSIEEVKRSAFPEVIDASHRIGIISVQWNSNQQRMRAIPRRCKISQESDCSSSVVFFHKSVQEKLAGDYLAGLLANQPLKLMSYLDSLSTIKDVLSVHMILRFACGTNAIVAGKILTRLMQIFKSDLKPLISKYYDEILNLEDSLKIQQFIELCLCCIFEADAEDHFHSLLPDLFPNGRVHLLGISAFVSVALGYFISHSKKDGVRSVTLRPVAHAGDNIHPVGSLAIFRDDAQQNVKWLSDEQIRNISKEYLNKFPGNVHGGNTRLAEHSPASLMAYIQMWEACERLPKASESNIGPVICSFQHSKLEILDIRGFKIGEKIRNLLESIENGHLSQLLELFASNIGLKGKQTERLARAIKMTRRLRTLDIAFNEGGNSLSVLAEQLPLLHSLQKLYVSKLQASASDMEILSRKLPMYGSKLTEFQIPGNHLNDSVAETFSENLPIATLLTNLWISVDGLSQKCHQQFLLTIKHLTRLQTLRVFHSPYPDDLLVNMAEVLTYLSNLDTTLTLTAHRDVDPCVNSTSWQSFKDVLEKMAMLKHLELTNIALPTLDDFQDLITMCRQLGYTNLCYSMNCLPENTIIPDDDFFMLR